MKLQQRTRIAGAVATLAASLANHVHAALFRHMARSGLVLFEGDPTAVMAELKRIGDQLKEQGERALAEASKAGTLSAKTKESVDELLIKHNELQAELRDFERSQAEANKAGTPPLVKSYGQQLVESDAYKAMVKSGGRGSMSMEVKAAVTSTAAGGLIRPLYETEPVSLPKQRLVIRDLLPVVPIATSSVDYPKQGVRTNAAAPVAEAAAKPYSDYTWTNATATVRTIAHLAKLTRQAMDDAPRLVAEVDAEMRYGLGLVEEAQLLYGSGVGQNLLGIVPQATAYLAPIVIAGATRIDVLRLAMLQASLNLFPSDGIVLNEGDWAGIELTKTTDGAYLFANPQGTIQPRLWGLPVVPTPAMPLDAFLVGAFRIGATLYDRMSVELLISTENVDDFEKNLATMRAEERIALAVKRPLSFIVGDFGLVA